MGFVSASSALALAESTLALAASVPGLEDRVLGSILLPAVDRWEISLGLQGLPGSLVIHPYLTVPANDVGVVATLLRHPTGT
ncbi:MAG: hypothetical protein M0013_13465 [Actinomycetota bacterium]|nr:hypothetical protein [Actinomycetota bacterium]